MIIYLKYAIKTNQLLQYYRLNKKRKYTNKITLNIFYFKILKSRYSFVFLPVS